MPESNDLPVARVTEVNPGDASGQKAEPVGGVDEALKRNAATWPMADRRPRTVGLRSQDVIKGTALVLAMYIGLKLLWNVYALAIVAFLGVLFGLAISRVVEPMTRFAIPLGKREFKLPRGLAAGIVVLGIIGSVVGVFAWSAPTLKEQFGVLQRKLPEAVDRVDSWLDSQRGGVLGPLIAGLTIQGVPDTTKVTARDPTTGAPIQSLVVTTPDTTKQSPGLVKALLNQVIVTGQPYLFPFISSAFAALAGMLLVAMLATYVAADPGLYHRGVMHLVPHRHRARAGDVMSQMATILRRFMRAQLIGMLTIGVVTTIALYALGIPAALPLGILAGLLEFIPNVGPLISALPAVLMGFIDGPQKALSVAIVYMIIQQLENHLLIPILMKEGVDLPPVLTIIAQALMAIVFGFLGLLIAVPLLAIVMVAVRTLYVEGVVGDVIIEEEEEELA